METLLPFFAITMVFGLPFLIIVMLIRLHRERMRAKMQLKSGVNLTQRLEEFEHRQDQLIKRVQSLETIIVDADLGNHQLRAHQQDAESVKSSSHSETSYPLKNKLRS